MAWAGGPIEVRDLIDFGMCRDREFWTHGVLNMTISDIVPTPLMIG